MTEATINHCVVDVMFTCECGTALLIIDRHQTDKCDVCGRVWGVKVELVDLSQSETEEVEE